MVLISFTKKFDDKTDPEGQGFEFVFYCDVDGEPIVSKFVQSHAGKKAGNARIIGKGFSMGGGLMKSFASGIPGFSKPSDKDTDTGGDLASKGEEIAEEFAKKFGSMSPEWHKEHDEAFENAQREVKQVFNQCPVCNRWACVHCWDSQKSLCAEDAKNTVVCKSCHQAAGTGKFCINCGAPLVSKCSKCNTPYAVGTKFCPECGSSLG